MKIARIDNAGTTEYAVAGTGGGWIPLGQHGISPRSSADLVDCLDQIKQVLAGSTSADEIKPTRFLSPIVNPLQSLAIGRNYRLHAKETGSSIPEQPMMFTKLAGSFTGAVDDVTVNPALTSKLDYEVELVVLIGKEASRVKRDDALQYVAGYLVGNDISARDCQKRDVQFDFAKGMSGFGPIGPWITTADEVPDAQNLTLSSSVNGEVRQSSNTSQMIFDVPFLIEYLSAGVTLHPGDVIWTGTPHGVAAGMGSDDAFLKSGDQVSCEIQQLGELNNRIHHLV